MSSLKINVPRFHCTLVAYLALILLASGCSRIPSSLEYHQQYKYLNMDLSQAKPMVESDYFIIFLVNARHLDYGGICPMVRTMAKHPSDGSKNGDVGHSWIYLKGIINGHPYVLEGGYSGEIGTIQPRYFDGIMNYIEYGYSNPTANQMTCPREEPNPIKYLWEDRKDGFFQHGSGGHRPTFAAKLDLTEEQFRNILMRIHPQCVDYSSYSLTGPQCSTFVQAVADMAGLELDCPITISIQNKLAFAHEEFLLWTDPCYASITLVTPDGLEKELMYYVHCGRCEYALDWYMDGFTVKSKKKTPLFDLEACKRYIFSRQVH